MRTLGVVTARVRYLPSDSYTSNSQIQWKYTETGPTA